MHYALILLLLSPEVYEYSQDNHHSFPLCNKMLPRPLISFLPPLPLPLPLPLSPLSSINLLQRQISSLPRLYQRGR